MIFAFFLIVKKRLCGNSLDIPPPEEAHLGSVWFCGGTHQVDREEGRQTSDSGLSFVSHATPSPTDDRPLYEQGSDCVSRYLGPGPRLSDLDGSLSPLECR
jgi:hypothetical protein